MGKTEKSKPTTKPKVKETYAGHRLSPLLLVVITILIGAYFYFSGSR